MAHMQAWVKINTNIIQALKKKKNPNPQNPNLSTEKLLNQVKPSSHYQVSQRFSLQTHFNMGCKRISIEVVSCNILIIVQYELTLLEEK